MKFNIKMVSALLAVSSISGCKKKSGTETSNLMSESEVSKLPSSKLVMLLLEMDIKEISKDNKLVIPKNKVQALKNAAEEDGIQVEVGGSMGLTNQNIDLDETIITLVDRLPPDSSTPTIPSLIVKPVNDPTDPGFGSTSPAINSRIEDLIRNDPFGRLGGSIANSADYDKTYDKAEYSRFDRTVSGADSQVIFDEGLVDRLKLPRTLSPRFDKDPKDPLVLPAIDRL